MALGSEGGAALRCRVCGYDLSDIDFARAAYRCPECGEINIPGDARVAPLTLRARLGAARGLLIALWPGAATGGVIGLHAFVDHDWSAMVGVFGAMIGGVICLTWPWAAAEILLHARVPERERRRYMPWLPLAGMVGNVALAVAVARGMYLVG